jgi:hypothetical protein
MIPINMRGLIVVLLLLLLLLPVLLLVVVLVVLIVLTSVKGKTSGCFSNGMDMDMELDIVVIDVGFEIIVVGFMLIFSLE